MNTELLEQIRKEVPVNGRRKGLASDKQGELSVALGSDRTGEASTDTGTGGVSTREGTTQGTDSTISRSDRSVNGSNGNTYNIERSVTEKQSSVPNVASELGTSRRRQYTRRIKENIAGAIAGVPHETDSKKPKEKPLSSREAEALREKLITGYYRMYKLAD